MVVMTSQMMRGHAVRGSRMLSTSIPARKPAELSKNTQQGGSEGLHKSALHHVMS